MPVTDSREPVPGRLAFQFEPDIAHPEFGTNL